MPISIPPLENSRFVYAFSLISLFTAWVGLSASPWLNIYDQYDWEHFVCLKHHKLQYTNEGIRKSIEDRDCAEKCLYNVNCKTFMLDFMEPNSCVHFEETPYDSRLPIKMRERSTICIKESTVGPAIQAFDTDFYLLSPHRLEAEEAEEYCKKQGDYFSLAVLPNPISGTVMKLIDSLFDYIEYRHGKGSKLLFNINNGISYSKKKKKIGGLTTRYTTGHAVCHGDPFNSRNETQLRSPPFHTLVDLKLANLLENEAKMMAEEL